MSSIKSKANTSSSPKPKTNIAIPTRGIQVVEGHSPCFAAGLQVLCFLLTPIRKALVHFYLTCRNQPLEPQHPAEWKVLSGLGKLFQELMLPDNSNSNNSSNTVDPTDFYQLMKPLLRIQNRPPKDATEALQLLLELLQTCVATVPVTRQLWSALLDMAGLGLIAKQATIGKIMQPTQEKGSEHNIILQRTKRDTCIMYCPFPLIDKFDTLAGGLENTTRQHDFDYDWDAKPNDYDFEVKIPLLTKSSTPSRTGEPKWTTTKTLQFSTLPAFLFLGVNRFDAEGELVNPAIDIPKELDVTKYCVPGTTKGNMAKYALVGGILYDEDDYVAILKNPNSNTISEEENGDQDEEVENWNLLETEEVIPMTETDVMEFLKGEEGGVCGTVLVYSTLHESSHTGMNQLLSDIIISHVSGKLDSKADFYYEEEWIEEEIIED
jgi:hypothetical protein